VAFGGNRSDRDLNAEINVTPLVDVMLVMLIIFMLVTPMLQKGVGVDLPRARNLQAVPENKDQVVMVVLRQNGDLYIDSDRVARGALEPELHRRLDLNQGLQLQVKADRNVPYGAVKEILRAGQAAGYRGASLIAEEIRAANARPVPAGGGG
jgi:biopolymer transport protein TolR